MLTQNVNHINLVTSDSLKGKSLKIFLSKSYWANSKIIWYKRSLGEPLPKLFKFLCLVENHGRYRGNDSRHPLSIDLVRSERLVTCPGLLLKTFGSRDVKIVFRIGGKKDMKMGVKGSDSFTILGLWVLGLAVSNINEFQLQTYESKTLFLMTTLQYYCISRLTGTRWIKNLCAKDAGCACNKITERVSFFDRERGSSRLAPVHKTIFHQCVIS